jgi:DNA-binding MarR family transcriptional regulator
VREDIFDCEEPRIQKFLSNSLIVTYLDVKIIRSDRVPNLKAGDAIDLFIAEWTRERPDLDFEYLATLGRILRISAHLRENMDGWLSPFGLTWEMFDLLASLRRSGERDGLRPTDLYHACMLSSGATTNRIDRAETLGLVERRPDPADGRATRIALTRKGTALADKAMTQHAARAGDLAEVLSAEERKRLGQLLGKLLHSMESDAVPARKPAAVSNGRTSAR